MQVERLARCLALGHVQALDLDLALIARSAGVNVEA
jgi:hypothetical protein